MTALHDLPTAIGISIVAASLLAVLACWTRQPLLVGYIAAGALLGPRLGFGLVSDEASIEVIGEIGLIFLLFIVGLEINVPALVQAGRVIAVTGLLQFPFCVALAWPAADVLAGVTGGRFDRLYLAVALALSSTLIVVKLLFDKFEIGTFAGRLTVGVLVFQDVWAIAFMALQPNLGDLRLSRLGLSALAGLALVGTAALLSRFLLPRFFRGIGSSPEMVLLAAVAWCFSVAGAAGWLGLSREMGALIAGMVIAGFPYGTEVTSRLSGVRDFFVTLFFVALGLRLPVPTGTVLLLAGIATLAVVATRFVSLFGIFALLRLDARTAAVVALNLAQVSEFSLVIATLGVGLGHVSRDALSVVLYTVLLTAVLSTYGILFNDRLARGVARALAAVGLSAWWRLEAGQAEPAAGVAAPREHDIFLLGVSLDGLAFFQHLEREHPEMRKRIVAIDFNPETLEKLQGDGVECHYGDISNPETLRHAGIAGAGVVVSSVSDWFLKGTDNRRLLRLVRGLAPGAIVVVTADRLKDAADLYASGADYVLIPPVLAAGHLYRLLLDPSSMMVAGARQRQAAELFASIPPADVESGAPSHADDRVARPRAQRPS
jgi:Kef-type K+ transport system membrane component KefB